MRTARMHINFGDRFGFVLMLLFLLCLEIVSHLQRLVTMIVTCIHSDELGVTYQRYDDYIGSAVLRNMNCTI